MYNSSRNRFSEIKVKFENPIRPHEYWFEMILKKISKIFFRNSIKFLENCIQLLKTSIVFGNAMNLVKTSMAFFKSSMEVMKDFMERQLFVRKREHLVWLEIEYYQLAYNTLETNLFLPDRHRHISFCMKILELGIGITRWCLLL